jgi:hypothetical protein
MPADLQGAVLHFLYTCLKASEFEDGHFFALASTKNKLHFQDKAKACRFFQIISDDMCKATKQDEMVGKYYFCVKNPKAECIPHNLSQQWLNAIDHTTKADAGLTCSSNGKQKEPPPSKSAYIAVAKGSSKKMKCHDGSATETP